MTAERTRVPPSPRTLPIDILLVEDSPLEVELTLKPLRKVADIDRIEVARDGGEALAFSFGRASLRSQAGVAPPVLVWLDVKLPKLDGLEVLRAPRANARTIL